MSRVLPFQSYLSEYVRNGLKSPFNHGCNTIVISKFFTGVVDKIIDIILLENNDIICCDINNLYYFIYDNNSYTLSKTYNKEKFFRSGEYITKLNLCFFNKNIVYVVTNKYKRIEFSFNKCLLCNPIDVNNIKEDPDRSKILKLQQWFKRFKLNSRRWIEPQITEFRKSHKRVCSVSGATDEELHVDHVYPLTYHQLVYNYILQMPFHWTQFEIPKEHETNKYTEDFCNYHKQVAQLRYLTKTLNLKHPKSKLVDVVQFFKINNLL